MKWNNSLLVAICTFFLLISTTAYSQPQAPVLNMTTDGTWVELTWTTVPRASGYILSLVPIPYTGTPIITADMGNLTSISATLWAGAAYYMAIQSRDKSGLSPYSNIIEVIINPPPLSGSFQVFAYNDLGMHCYDPDFSVFSILPLYNVLHAQVIQKGTTPKIVGPTVTVTYTAMADGTGSINTTSIGKTNFWDYVFLLFGQTPSMDEGLMGATMPGSQNQPQPLPWAGGETNGFEASGIPITTLDDALNINSYPLMTVQALDPANSNILSSLPVVLPVSNEMACNLCHDTGNVAANLSGINWSQNSAPDIQFRENILTLHDYKNSTNLSQSQPVLCASCHYSPALDLTHTGPTGIQVTNPTLSRAIHGYHASKMTTPAPGGNTCYYCHPGEKTQCARGVMNTAGLTCLECHGTMTAVGQATRRSWTDMPMCQSCHTGDALNNFDSQIVRRSTYTDSPNNATFIVANNKRFAEQSGTLYRNSVGHNGVACESCHGSPHAEWPSQETNDNLAALTIQGHDGMISECTACHESGLPLTLDGPHGMHNVNSQTWVNGHEHFKTQQTCGSCHGAAGSGTIISKAAANRTFSVEGRTVSIAKGTQIDCGLCHENELANGDDEHDD